MTQAALYDDADLYDLLHVSGTAREAKLLTDLFALHGNGGRRWLEPACGTGRLLESLARKGFSVTGYDRSPPALERARQRLARFGSRARVFAGDLRSFRSPARHDAAFCLLGTFRHLMTDRDALAHLSLTAAALASGGLYIIGLDLADYDHPADDEETWAARSGARRARHVMIALAPDRRRRRERVVNFIELSGSRRGLIESSYDLRSYDRSQWNRLVARSPFQVADALTHRPGGDCGAQDALFVLRRR